MLIFHKGRLRNQHSPALELSRVGETAAVFVHVSLRQSSHYQQHADNFLQVYIREGRLFEHSGRGFFILDITNHAFKGLSLLTHLGGKESQNKNARI